MVKNKKGENLMQLYSKLVGAFSIVSKDFDFISQCEKQINGESVYIYDALDGLDLYEKIRDSISLHVIDSIQYYVDEDIDYSCLVYNLQGCSYLQDFDLGAVVDFYIRKGLVEVLTDENIKEITKYQDNYLYILPESNLKIMKNHSYILELLDELKKVTSGIFEWKNYYIEDSDYTKKQKAIFKKTNKELRDEIYIEIKNTGEKIQTSLLKEV